jgi:hypothetical protein
MLHRELLMTLVNSWRYVRRTTPFVLLLLSPVGLLPHRPDGVSLTHLPAPELHHIEGGCVRDAVHEGRPFLSQTYNQRT